MAFELRRAKHPWNDGVNTMSKSTGTADHPNSLLVLALNIGTSSIRALLFDRLGRAIEGMMARQSWRLDTDTDGAAVADPDAMVDRVWRCIDEVLERAAELSGKIEGVALCTFVSNILGVDEQGQAVTPLMTYADTRSADEVDRLRREFDEEAVHQRTGCLFHTSYLPAQFRWLARARPDIFQRAVRWMSIGEYMERQIFPSAGSRKENERGVSYSVASWTGLLDRKNLVWDGPLLAALPVDAAQLSPLVDVDVPRRGLRDRFADRWPALRGVPWFPAVGDGAAANVGSGCVTPARVALTMGTTTAVRLVTEEEVMHVPDGLWCYRVDGRRSLPGGALSEGGNVFAWMRDTLHLPVERDLEDALARMVPDGHGLTALPFLAGERSPGWVGDARATLHGLSLATTPLDILRASMEGVAYRIALIFDRLESLLPSDFQVVASGGALLNSPVWVQIIADIVGRPVAISEVEEASARGAALLALEALGALDDATDSPAFIGEPIVPDDDRHARYRKAAKRQQMLYEILVDRQNADAV